MTSFDSGMQLGASMYNNMQMMGLRQRQEERARQEHDERMKQAQLTTENMTDAQIQRRQQQAEYDAMAGGGAAPRQPVDPYGSAPEDYSYSGVGNGPTPRVPPAAPPDQNGYGGPPGPQAPPAPVAPAGPGGGGGPAPRGASTNTNYQGGPSASQAETTRRAAALGLRYNHDINGYNAAMEQARSLDARDIYETTVQGYMKSPKEFEDRVIPLVNTHSQKVTLAPQKDAKGNPTGYQMMIVNDRGEATSKMLTMAQGAQLAGAYALMDAGHADKAMPLIKDVDKDLAAAVATENNLQGQAAGHNNTAQHYAGMDTYHNRMAAAAEARSAHDRMGSAITTVGLDGEPSIMIPVLGKDGQMTMSPVPLPAGQRLPRQVDTKQVEALASTLVGTPNGTQTNGVPNKHTPESAYRAAYNIISNPQNPGAGSGPNPTGDAAAILRSQGAARQANPPGLPPRSGLPATSGAAMNDMATQNYIARVRAGQIAQQQGLMIHPGTPTGADPYADYGY